MFLQNFVNCLEISEKFTGNSEYILGTFVTFSHNLLYKNPVFLCALFKKIRTT